AFAPGKVVTPCRASRPLHRLGRHGSGEGVFDGDRGRTGVDADASSRARSCSERDGISWCGATTSPGYFGGMAVLFVTRFVTRTGATDQVRGMLRSKTLRGARNTRVRFAPRLCRDRSGAPACGPRSSDPRAAGTAAASQPI